MDPKVQELTNVCRMRGRIEGLRDLSAFLRALVDMTDDPRTQIEGVREWLVAETTRLEMQANTLLTTARGGMKE